MQHNSKKIFSELSTFFRNNDNSDAIFSVSRVMDGLRFGATDMGCEKCHNCKFTALQTPQLLILFPFFFIGQRIRQLILDIANKSIHRTVTA